MLGTTVATRSSVNEFAAVSYDYRDTLLASAADLVSKDSLTRDVVNAAIERALSASPPPSGETATITGHGS